MTVTGVQDLAGNSLTNTTPGSEQEYTIDNTAPSVTLSSSVANPTNASPFSVTATFSADIDVSTLAVGDIQRARDLIQQLGRGLRAGDDVQPHGDGRGRQGDPDLSILRRGAHRAEIEDEMGKPKVIQPIEEGRYVALYVIKLGAPKNVDAKGESLQYVGRGVGATVASGAFSKVVNSIAYSGGWSSS